MDTPSQPTVQRQPPPTLFPTLPLAPTTVAPAPPDIATSVPDTGWLAGGSGVEVRRIQVGLADDLPPAPLVVARIDPAATQLRAIYAPDQPRLLRTWFEEQQPIIAINGGFFTEDFRTTALVISDGAASGESYAGFGGMLAVAPDGAISIRPLRDRPYDPNEPLNQAMQSFPMLVMPGGAPAPIEDDGARARRTAVAQDRSGRLLLIVCPTSGFTLPGLAEWLAASDLDIDVALNLDGGSSTGMFVKAGAVDEQIDSFGPLPLVLLVEPK
jgi:uncharacterized protein YigE (DUF2233 family)